MKRWSLRALALLTLAGLLFWALRHAPLPEIWVAVRRLQSWQITALLGMNALSYLLFTLRWWTIVQAENRKISFWPLLRVRVAVFGVSYFTFGPQVGGEALQVLVLRRAYGLTYTHATASVLMDKLLEFLINFLLLALGLAAVLQHGVLLENGMQRTGSLFLLTVLVAWPPCHLILLQQRRHPLTLVLRALPWVPQSSRPLRFIRAAENLAGRFCRRHPRRLLAALAFSGLAGAGLLLDYWLLAGFLQLPLSFWEAIAGWWMGWLALLLPLPGGLGAMEASQVFALSQFGFGAASALSVALVMRGRDLLVGGLGLLLAALDTSLK
jgi:uncharacterized membrane protein YbhN (UPF0104 family)